MTRLPRVHTRGRLIACGAGTCLTMLFSIAAVLAMGVITFPAPTGVVWARIDRAGPPAASTNGRSATVDEPLATASPGTITMSGSAAQIPVAPSASSETVPPAPAESSVVGR